MAFWEQKRRIAFNVHVEPYAKAERNDGCLRSKDREQQWWQLMSPKGILRLFIVGGGEGNLKAYDERCGSS